MRQRFPRSRVYDFLKEDLYLDFLKHPSRLRQELLAAEPAVLGEPVILDEVQKVPAVLDEVQWLIENRGLSFVLCGSSARKLKRGQANLLGGRAWRFELFPLTTRELGPAPLLRILNQGLIPSHYLQDASGARRSLKAYLADYLKEEVFAEGLVRRAPAFSRFFDALGYSHGELVNCSNIARDCGVDAKTVREYFQILCDTLLGDFLKPYKRRQDRHVLSRAPKFYLFDVGVAGALVGRDLREERGEAFGRALEHLVFMELRAHRRYTEKDYPIRYWRTKSGQEVDFVLGEGEVAVEVKGSPRVDDREWSGLRTFVQDYAPKQSLVVTNEGRERRVGPVLLLPWRDFCSRLWAGEIL